jgi:hypothetical protein
MPPPILTLRTPVVASPDQLSCEVMGEALVLSLKDGVYYSLNEVGCEVWSLLRERRTPAELCDALLERYPDVSTEQCEQDVLALLRCMAQWGLVELADA